MRDSREGRHRVSAAGKVCGVFVRSFRGYPGRELWNYCWVVTVSCESESERILFRNIMTFEIEILLNIGTKIERSLYYHRSRMHKYFTNGKRFGTKLLSVLLFGLFVCVDPFSAILPIEFYPIVCWARAILKRRRNSQQFNSRQGHETHPSPGMDAPYLSPLINSQSSTRGGKVAALDYLRVQRSLARGVRLFMVWF